MTPAECVPLVAVVELTADMRAIKACAAHPPAAMGGREGAATDMRASHATADMRSPGAATHMSASEAATHMPASEAAAHVAATATVASATATVASAAATTTTTTVASAATPTPTSQSVGCYGNGSQRDSRGQDDCSLQLETLHGTFPSVSGLNPIVIACRPPQMRDPLRAC
jgi:hypothetical protein